MGKFIVERHFDLSFLGKQWKDAHMVLRALTVKEMREVVNKKLSSAEPTKVIDETVALLKANFIRGVVPDSEGKLVKFEKEDIEELPSQVLEKAVVFLVGQLS